MAKRAHQTTITLTDSKGVDHDFEPVELFTVGKKSFALLKPAKSKNEVVLFRFSMDKKGNPKTFELPTEKEVDQAMEVLGAPECGCGCCCDDEADLCHKPEKKPAKKKAAARKPAKKAARKARK